MSQDLVITAHVPAPPDQVYAAWLSPEGLSRWWWVAIGDTTYAVDGREGGEFLVQSTGAGIGVRGTFRTLREPDLIELTWIWLEGETAGPEELVRVDLAPQDGGTLVTVTHQVVDPEGLESYRQGWTYVLDNLARLHRDGAAAAEPQKAITLTQLVPAARHEAFAAWVEPERLATWWWPGRDTSYEVDARRGGAFAIHSAQLGVGASGTFLELEEGERIVMTWLWESGGPAPKDLDLVTVTFEEAPDGNGDTLVTLVHEFAVPQLDTSNPRQGWAAVLSSLAGRPVTG